MRGIDQIHINGLSVLLADVVPNTYNQRAVKIKYQNNNETAVYVSNISISHRFLIGQVVKGKHEIYQIGRLGLGREIEV